MGRRGVRHARAHRRRKREGDDLPELPPPTEARGVHLQLALEARVGPDDLALRHDEVEGLVRGHGVRGDEVCADDRRGARDAHRAVHLQGGARCVSIEHCAWRSQ